MPRCLSSSLLIINYKKAFIALQAGELGRVAKHFFDVRSKFS
jgi:hypothetical protein